MASENVKNISLFFTTKDEQPLSDCNSIISVKTEGPVITDNDSINKEINMDVELPIQSKNDSEVISDHEYDSDYQYKRITKRPGPKSKTMYKLSQDERNKVIAKYGIKKMKLNSEFTDIEENDDNFNFIKIEIFKEHSGGFTREKVRAIALDEEIVSKEICADNKMRKSKKMGKHNNKEKQHFTQSVVKNEIKKFYKKAFADIEERLSKNRPHVKPEFKNTIIEIDSSVYAGNEMTSPAYLDEKFLQEYMAERRAIEEAEQKNNLYKNC